MGTVMLPTPDGKRPERCEQTAQEAGAEQFHFRWCPDNLQSLCSKDRVGDQDSIKRRDMVTDQDHTALGWDMFTPLDPHAAA